MDLYHPSSLFYGEPRTIWLIPLPFTHRTTVHIKPVSFLPNKLELFWPSKTYIHLFLLFYTKWCWRNKRSTSKKTAEINIIFFDQYWCFIFFSPSGIGWINPSLKLTSPPGCWWEMRHWWCHMYIIQIILYGILELTWIQALFISLSLFYIINCYNDPLYIWSINCRDLAVFYRINMYKAFVDIYFSLPRNWSDPLEIFWPINWKFENLEKVLSKVNQSLLLAADNDYKSVNNIL